MTIDQLAEKRRGWVESSRENGFEEGIRNLLSDLYPDNAHFIYELLQNAEDAGASEVRFRLTNCGVEFEHNGKRLFSLEDVDAITSIGFTTKKDDPTKIGKFGIGFKAVFAYTSTPEIESGEYHFHIRDLVVPDTEGLPPASLGEARTSFVFPFDNPGKPPEKAREEIEKNLRELDESALLFLSNIETIKYELPNSATGYLKRKAIDENQIEISVKRSRESAPESTHYLRFENDVTVEDADGVKEYRVAVAFGMEEQENNGWKIIPLNKAEVCIYFPAAKETSNLLFHLHAPFASTVARDSVRDDPANVELLSNLADLVAESMSTIRDRGLLDVEFLATLPNDTDSLHSFYTPIMERLTEAFNTEKLTPTKQGNHAPASDLYRGSHQLINLIDDKDLAAILGLDSSVSLWAAIPQLSQQRDKKSGQFVEDRKIKRQNERIRTFLDMVDTRDWGIDDFIKVFEYKSERRKKWLSGKQAPWHQKLYEWLGASVSSASSQPRYVVSERIDKLSSLRIVRCCDGVYRTGRECHFSSADTEQQDNFHYVAKNTYTSGTDTDQKKNARKFLEDIGVSEIGEAERVEAILKQRYVKGTIELRKQHRKRDLERFIALVENDPERKSLFRDYFIFEIDKDSPSSSWRKPDGIFLDSPYTGTGLKAYYDALDEASEKRKWALSPKYVDLGLDREKLGTFAKAVGVQVVLKVTEQKIPLDHPEWKTRFQHAARQRITDTSINRDYSIPEFKDLLENPAIDKSKLVWRTMCSLHERILKAQFRPNQNHDICQADSSLVHLLKGKAWVPQVDGDCISFERPCDASHQGLPSEGFQYVTNWAWLKAIGFGKATSERKKEYIQLNQHAKKMGFDSVDEAETMAGIVKDLRAHGKSPEDLQNLIIDKIHHDGQRRQRLIIKDLIHAGGKQYEIRARSINTTRDSIDSRTYLRARYTTEMNNVECQMCRQRMPFKKRNSYEDYFEAVEALGREHFPKEHEAQYLALCPQCTAKYKEYVKRNKLENAQEKLYRALKDSDDLEVLLELSGYSICIRFTEKHWQDLKTVVFYYENLYVSED